MIYTDGTHIVADTLEELHAWAKLAGIKRCWFEGTRKGHPHYDFPKQCPPGVMLTGVKPKMVSGREVLRLSQKMLERKKRNDHNDRLRAAQGNPNRKAGV